MKKFLLIISAFFGSIIIIPFKKIFSEIPLILKASNEYISNSLIFTKSINSDIVRYSLKSNSPLIDESRKYSRTLTDKYFKKRKEELHKLGKRQNDGITSKQVDGYTGKILFGGDDYQYDHIISSREIFDRYKGLLTEKQIAILTNIRENITPTLRKINQAKGKFETEKLKNSSRLSELSLDMELIYSKESTAKEAIQNEAKRMINNNLSLGLLTQD